MHGNFKYRRAFNIVPVFIQIPNKPVAQTLRDGACVVVSVKSLSDELICEKNAGERAITTQCFAQMPMKACNIRRHPTSSIRAWQNGGGERVLKPGARASTRAAFLFVLCRSRSHTRGRHLPRGFVDSDLLQRGTVAESQLVARQPSIDCSTDLASLIIWRQKSGEATTEHIKPRAAVFYLLSLIKVFDRG